MLKVMLNPGHAGTSGASGLNAKIQETEFAEIQAQEISRLLRFAGVTCNIVRQNEVGGLGAVGKLAQHYDVALSLHFNASDHKEHGTLWLGGSKKPQAMKFAKELCDSLSRQFGFKNGGFYPRIVSVTSEFDKTSCPVAFLLETEFIDDETDYEVFKVKVLKSAKIIADKIISYMKEIT
jgi:N-acetylmuramoyl-L-alanine amidase